jgi:FkbM family methyltransferase
LNTFREKYQEIKAGLPNSDIHRTISELKKNLNGRPLVLYGLGCNFNCYWYWCQECGLRVSCVGDTHKKGMSEIGLPILDMQELKRDFKDAVVLICSSRYSDEICKALIQHGFAPESVIPCPDKHWLRETPLTFEQYLEGYEWAYGFFDDQLSRQHILDRVRYNVLAVQPPPNTANDVYYEDGFIELQHGEVFIDAGARDGDTVLQFIDKMKDAGKTYKKIYAFEPSPINYSATVERLSQIRDIEIVQKGLWSCEMEMPFSEQEQFCGASSFVIEPFGSNRISVPVTSLDLFFKDAAPCDLPSFIKMDIEGSENEALKGAANIIKLAKPKLAICAYHKTEDIYELPQTILGIRDDYKLALRAPVNIASPQEVILYGF